MDNVQYFRPTPPLQIHDSIVETGCEQSVQINPTLSVLGGSIKIPAEMHLEILNENLIVHSAPAICEDPPANQYKDH